MGYKSKILPFVCVVIVLDLILLNSYYDITVKDFTDKTKRPNRNIHLIKPRISQDVINNNPCDEHEKERSFQHEGRISEEKCIEYVWKRSQFEKCKQLKKQRVFGILEGHATLPGDFPHMAAIGWRTLQDGWVFKCGATLISPNFLVTAAHCTKSKPNRRLQNMVPEIVRLGVVNLEHSPGNHPVDVNIATIIKHPKYKSPKKYYDIALLKLQGEIEFGATIQPACLWTESSTKKLEKSVVTSGWGITNIDKRNPSSVLRAVNLFMINSSMCEDLLNPYTNRLWPKLMDHQLCAGELAGGHDACQGDSGGPLQVEMSHQHKMHYIIGVTSFGYGCGRRNVPGLYTRVASFIDWIEENVWKEEMDERRLITTKENRQL